MAGRRPDADAAWKNSRCFIQMEGEIIRLNAEINSQKSENRVQQWKLNALEHSVQNLLAEVAIYERVVQHREAQTVSNIDSVHNSSASFQSDRRSREDKIERYIAAPEYENLQRECSKLQMGT
jgi:hypothetical protein